MKLFFVIAIAASVNVGCTRLTLENDHGAEAASDLPTGNVLPVSDVEWEKLNPARGDKSPLAGTLWGDRNGNVATGFLARFADGFASPPHIHNATYRAVVISGHIHNDDPDAATMWMPTGSFWTQPEGEVHITAARGEHNLALVEIDRGPYLVGPPAEAFDNGERPVNVHTSNVVWVDMYSDAPFPKGPQIAYLWGELKGGESNGTFVKLPTGFAGKLHNRGSTFRAVVIQGQLQYLGANGQTLDPGSYFSATEEAVHPISSGEKEVIIYVLTDGKYELKSGP